MKWKSKSNLILLIGLMLLFIQGVKAYNNHVFLTDGNILLHGGIQLKPNSIHTYVPQYDGRVKNITLDSGTLGLSKSDFAYNIACSTYDNITINLYYWFYSDKTQFHVIAENETALSFTINVRNKGEPETISGASSWSYNNDTSTVFLTCSNNALVTISWVSLPDLVSDYSWIAIFLSGIFLMAWGPSWFAWKVKKVGITSDSIERLGYAMLLFLIGFGLLIMAIYM